MKTRIDITLPNDFELICLVTSSDAKEIIQHYIDKVSLPKQMSVHPEEPFGAAIEIFLDTIISQDPAEVEKSVGKLLKSGYKEELKKIIRLDLEQPECESMLREVIKKWKDKTLVLRLGLRKTEEEFKICNYGN